MGRPQGANGVPLGCVWGLGAKGVPMGCGGCAGDPQGAWGSAYGVLGVDMGQLWGALRFMWGAHGAFEVPGGFTEGAGGAWGAHKVLRGSLWGFWDSYGGLGYVWGAKGCT